MNPLAAYVYSKSSVLLDRYKPLGTILVSTVTLLRYTGLLAVFSRAFLSSQVPLWHSHTFNFPRLLSVAYFVACSDWLMGCLRSFWLVKVIFCFCSWGMQSNQVQWWLLHTFSCASRRLHTLLRIVFCLLSFLCSLWLVKVNYFAFVPETFNWKPFSTYTAHTLTFLNLYLI